MLRICKYLSLLTSKVIHGICSFVSRLIPSATCCNPCDDDSSSSSSGSGTPGAQGEQGEQGETGEDGLSAITFIADYTPGSQPVMPAEGATVVLTVTQSTAFLNVGQPVYVQGWGTMLVTAVPSDLSVTVQNPENTASGTYATNAAPGTVLAAGNKIVPGGIQGPTGATPADALLGANNLNDVDSASASRTNLGLGTAAVLATTTANGQLAPNDGALTNGDAVFATATGIETQAAATARTSLGLGSMAVQNKTAVDIEGGTIDGTTIGGTTQGNGTFTNLNTLGEMFITGITITPASAVQSLLAASPVTPNASKIKVVGNGGPVTLTAVPTITVPALQDGQQLMIVGTDDTNTVTFQNESSLAGSKMKLGAATRALGAGDVLSLVWDEDMDTWLETGFVNNS
jgi:hypothetical protein